jgi:hypothetical protein
MTVHKQYLRNAVFDGCNCFAELDLLLSSIKIIEDFFRRSELFRDPDDFIKNLILLILNNTAGTFSLSPGRLGNSKPRINVFQ